jgi:hypothetical protein
MRTTITLDADVIAKLRAESRKTGRSFKETVNALLRLGLSMRPRKSAAPAFKVKARALGLRPGLNYDNLGDLLEHIEGPLHP